MVEKGAPEAFFSNFSMLLINCKYDKEINSIDFIQAFVLLKVYFDSAGMRSTTN